MERLAKTVLRAADLRERSFDINAAHEACVSQSSCQAARTTDEQFYTMSLIKACENACKDEGFDARAIQVIHLLLKNSWNDIIAWAKTLHKN